MLPPPLFGCSCLPPSTADHLPIHTSATAEVFHGILHLSQLQHHHNIAILLLSGATHFSGISAQASSTNNTHICNTLTLSFTHPATAQRQEHNCNLILSCPPFQPPVPCSGILASSTTDWETARWIFFVIGEMGEGHGVRKAGLELWRNVLSEKKESTFDSNISISNGTSSLLSSVRSSDGKEISHPDSCTISLSTYAPLQDSASSAASCWPYGPSSRMVSLLTRRGLCVASILIATTCIATRSYPLLC